MKNYIEGKIAANYFRGAEAVGGKIYFDENGFVFKSHALNIQCGETRIEYSDIISISKRNMLGIVPNGLSLFTKDNFEHKFVINSRNNIIEFLKSMNTQL